MPTRAEYRRAFAVESGPYVGPESYVVRATGGSDTTKLICDIYPIMSGIPQNDLLVDRPLYRPNAVRQEDRDRIVMIYDPPTGTITPDLPWTLSPIGAAGATTYEVLEAQTYLDLETWSYEELEGTGIDGIGERFEVLGPFDSQTLHQLLNDGLKQCWLVVEVPCIPTPGASRHSLAVVAPWLQDPNHIRQAGVLAGGEDRNQSDPFERIVYGAVERDGGELYFNTGSRTFNDGDLIYLRCYKRGFDHCRPAGGSFGDQSGLTAETDEAPVEREWLVAASLLIAWRRYGHLLEPIANQRLIRDQASAAAWFSDKTHEHFNAVVPQLTLRRARSFGPAFR